MADQPVFTLVTTTINVPTLLEDYGRDAREYGRSIEQFIVAGDRKSNPGTGDFCSRLERETGIACRYLDVDEQERILAGHQALRDYLPWNSIQRRNVALLAAWEGEADIVVTIDDDNFLAEEDYFGGHAHLGAETELEVARSTTGWWNVCEMLEEAAGLPFYHRGFPLSERWPEDATTSFETVRARAVVNAGLWLSDPDVDALTRLALPVKAVGASAVYRETLGCAVGTWSPFNSQNTALLRETLPAYFLFPYVGRYDDVWGSYVYRRIADELGDIVTYGSPLVQQDRNEHDLLVDLDLERLGMEHTESLLQALAACTVASKDYASAYAELAAQLPERLDEACAARGRDRAVFDRVCEGMTVWSALFAG